jgi:thiamine biosynthesis lipoprotein
MSTTESSLRVEHVMGMPVTLALRGQHAHDRTGLAAWSEVMESLREVDRIFSTYRPDSEISHLGNGTLERHEASSIVEEVLALGERARIESSGAFDIWLPDAEGTKRLDPSGVVKGWAVERAARILEDLDRTDYCLSAGGDMVCRTRDLDSAGWRIGIEDPHDPTRLLAVVPVTNGAVATSGTTHRGAHLVDARTGQAPVGIASVTVITESLTWADIDATAAYAHGPDAARWLSTRPDRTGLIVWADGTTNTFSTPAISAATAATPAA